MAPRTGRGGIKQLKQENKAVHQYKSACVERCHVHLLDKYISKLPPEAREKDIFYLKPRANVPQDPMAPWYLSVPVRRNKIGEMIKTMAHDGALDKTVTNHSLRGYGVTKMWFFSLLHKLSSHSIKSSS